MEHLPRRVVSITAVIVALPLLVILSPVAGLALVLYDLLGRRRDLPTLRLYAFAIVYLAHDWLVVPLSLWLWIRGDFGRNLDMPRHTQIQGWWIGSLLTWARRLLGISIDWPDLSTMPKKTVIVLSRHASMVDAVLPGYLFPALLDRPVHYVLKRELRWLPAIDIYGHRLGNHFVARNGNTEAEVGEIASLAAAAEPGAGLIIFPEGTYATPASRRRVRESLERRGANDWLAFASELTELLPPKPAGTLAMLQVQPDADLVIFGHEGMEGVAELSGLRGNLPSTRPVTVEWWVHERSTVPTDDAGRTRWLRDQWRTLDRWVGERRAMGELEQRE